MSADAVARVQPNRGANQKIGGSGSPKFVAALLARVAALEARVAQLEALISSTNHLTARGARERGDLEVLVAATRSAVGARFTAAELLRHAAAEPDLARALLAVDIVPEGGAIALGLLLRRMVGRVVNGAVLERTETLEHEGRVWRLRAVGGP